MESDVQTTNCNIKFEKADVYCGRGQGAFWNPMNCPIGIKGWLGNPVALGKTCPVCGNIHNDAGNTLICYESYLLECLTNYPGFNKAFYELKGKKLGCFCKPSPCHTDIMIKYLDELPVVKCLFQISNIPF